MDNLYNNFDKDFFNKLKWLIIFRAIFAVLLLGSTLIYRLAENLSFIDNSFLVLYGLIAGIIFLSIIYGLLLRSVKYRVLLAYFQLSIDTFTVTAIIFVTGNFSSVFPFLYLVVIIYASMLLYRNGSIVIATLCGLQYALMVDLEYSGILRPFGLPDAIMATNYAWSHIIYKILATTAACFAVALLSSFLTEQEKKAKKELEDMEAHVKRVDRLAAIGEMAAGLAHEIKNPLASLSGSIQMLKEDKSSDPEHDKLMRIVLRETDRLSSLVNNFLLFARPQAEKLETIKIDSAIEEIITLFKKDNMYSSRVSFKKNLIPEIWIRIDPDHLQQILWNLFLNAAEAIDEQGTVNIHMKYFENQYIGIVISDNGCGMSADIMGSIFDPFFTTKKSGTGLGLSIVHRILESYNTRLDVQSEIGKGAIFTLRFKQIAAPALPVSES